MLHRCNKIDKCVFRDPGVSNSPVPFLSTRVDKFVNRGSLFCAIDCTKLIYPIDWTQFVTSMLQNRQTQKCFYPVPVSMQGRGFTFVEDVDSILSCPHTRMSKTGNSF